MFFIDASCIPCVLSRVNMTDSVHAQEYSCGGLKLRALIYNILPPTSAATDYAIVLEKL